MGLAGRDSHLKENKTQDVVKGKDNLEAKKKKKKKKIKNKQNQKHTHTHIAK